MNNKEKEEKIMFHGLGWCGFGPYGFFGYGMFGYFIGVVFITLLFIFVVYIIYKSVHKVTSKENKTKNTQKEILKILNEKLAKGEINEKEYLRKKEIIMKD